MVPSRKERIARVLRIAGLAVLLVSWLLQYQIYARAEARLAMLNEATARQEQLEIKITLVLLPLWMKMKDIGDKVQSQVVSEIEPVFQQRVFDWLTVSDTIDEMVALREQRNELRIRLYARVESEEVRASLKSLAEADTKFLAQAEKLVWSPLRDIVLGMETERTREILRKGLDAAQQEMQKAALRVTMLEKQFSLLLDNYRAIIEIERNVWGTIFFQLYLFGSIMLIGGEGLKARQSHSEN
ncbi:hypothetical protein MYX77_04205 [Acidobacteriia bacterium AH_259_A11_L15]|nr:hypothetical protein [Acidobacteriia bacterium AH_259_A11_L15]